MEPLLVVLEGEVAGEIVPDGDGLRFSYLSKRDSATPLSLSMPQRPEQHPNDRIRPWLAGLLPNDGDVLQRWAARVGLAGAAPLRRPPRAPGDLGLTCLA
ncbi:MAG: HipA N-terminal domain-containing protein [bacterium]|nr:HipA N-terminal domain-containing protein [bacterium]MDE0667803.1 HipA N-terminal domain-containing protein [bacterium]MXZ31144.1 type II toxin-antitoxin system HipA family toxin [Acidimicrobiia bacterium]